MKKFLPVICLLIFSISLYNGCSEDETVTPPEEEVSIGQLYLNPSSFLENTSTLTTVRLTVPAGVSVKDSSARLVVLDADNNVSDELGFLYDNGDLTNGDEIIGDNILSAIININKPAGQLRLKVTAQVIKDNNLISGSSEVLTVTVYSDFSSGELNQLMQVQQDSYTKFNEYLAGNATNVENAITQLADWLKTQPGVEAVVTAGTSSIEIKYTSGVYGGLIFAQEDETGSVVTRGGIIQDDPRKTSRAISLKYQTTGSIDENKIPQRYFKTADLDPNTIGNRNVFIYAPYEAAFNPWNEGQKVVNVLTSSDFVFEITYYKDQQANISVLSNLTEYGLVVLATHGSQGKAFATGEIVDTNSAAYQDNYKAMLKAGKLAIWKNMVIKKDGTVSVKADIYAVRFPFITDLAGTFPNSVILNNSCESTMNSDLENAFTGKGAKTYFGYSKIVSSRFCIENADTLVRRLAKEIKNTGNSYIAANDPYSNHHAAFQLKGGAGVHYADDLINGDFEFGKIDGWTKSGDGRVISKLGTESPTQPNFMGIISTGLGFTEATGSIFQTFTVRQNQSSLTVKWNFLSEEFLEYIESQYQDYFRIVIRRKDGSEVVLLSKTIDNLAADFGATKEDPGNLIPVSPGIVFDRGGVYMTGWRTATFDITQFREERITLILAAGDVGDSVFDTAIILDEISVQ